MHRHKGCLSIQYPCVLLFKHGCPFKALRRDRRWQFLAHKFWPHYALISPPPPPQSIWSPLLCVPVPFQPNHLIQCRTNLFLIKMRILIYLFLSHVKTDAVVGIFDMVTILLVIGVINEVMKRLNWFSSLSVGGKETRTPIKPRWLMINQTW